MMIGFESDNGAKRSGQKWKRKHSRDQRSWNTEFHDHHTVQGPDQEDQTHPHGDLEQCQAQQAPQGQFRRGGIRKG